MRTRARTRTPVAGLAACRSGSGAGIQAASAALAASRARTRAHQLPRRLRVCGVCEPLFTPPLCLTGRGSKLAAKAPSGYLGRRACRIKSPGLRSNDGTLPDLPAGVIDRLRNAGAAGARRPTRTVLSSSPPSAPCREHTRAQGTLPPAARQSSQVRCAYRWDVLSFHLPPC